MEILNKILAILGAPFEGVWEYLDTHIDTFWVKLVVYFVWCALFGFICGLGCAVIYAIIYAKFHPGDSDE